MLSENDEKQLTGLLAAVRHAPHTMSIQEKVSVADTFRKWIYIIVSGIVFVVIVVMQIRHNTRMIDNLSPKVKVMWWMKENGYTNKDIEPHGLIKAPDFD